MAKCCFGGSHQFYLAQPDATLRHRYHTNCRKGNRAILTQNLMLALSVAAFGIYILYVSAAQVRRLHGGHGYLRPDDAI
ncbi:MAG: hypothetical protein VB959_08535, partial [Rhodospirillales bacterium]